MSYQPAADGGEAADTLAPMTGPTSSSGSRGTRSSSAHSSDPLVHGSALRQKATGPRSAPIKSAATFSVRDAASYTAANETRLGGRTKSTFHDEVHQETSIRVHMAAICLLAYVGVLTRVALEKLTDHFYNPDFCDAIKGGHEAGLFNALQCSGQLGAGYWLPNIVGCIVMGIFLRLSRTYCTARVVATAQRPFPDFRCLRATHETLAGAVHRRDDWVLRLLHDVCHVEL